MWILSSPSPNALPCSSHGSCSRLQPQPTTIHLRLLSNYSSRVSSLIACATLDEKDADSSTQPSPQLQRGQVNAGGCSGGAPRFIHPPTTAAVPFRPQFHSSSSLLLFSARTSHIVGATNKSTPRTGKFDSKNRRNTFSEQDKPPPGRRTTLERREMDAGEDGGGGVEAMESFADDGFVMSDLPGQSPDFWEGSKWDALGFFVQYMWAFGIAFAVIACGIAVATYNEGATDFKDTPVYKDSIQSQEFLEGPEASNSDVFESNPTEEAPSLE